MKRVKRTKVGNLDCGVQCVIEIHYSVKYVFLNFTNLVEFWGAKEEDKRAFQIFVILFSRCSFIADVNPLLQFQSHYKICHITKVLNYSFSCCCGHSDQTESRVELDAKLNFW
jgi:hypothetical protein